MRTYVVAVGDSPASIAARFAGCPRCSRDLIEANKTKETTALPNGFVTFKNLYIGEKLSLPDKWFNGTLDRLPQSYFDNLPSPTGVGAAPQGLGDIPTPGFAPTPIFPLPGGANAFEPGRTYKLTVWPIPNGSVPVVDPSQVLGKVGFKIMSMSQSIAGSFDVIATYGGGAPYTPSVADAQNTIVLTNISVTGAKLNPPGETIKTASAFATILSLVDAGNHEAAVVVNYQTQGFFQTGEWVNAFPSLWQAQIKYQYEVVISGQSWGSLGVTSIVDLGLAKQPPPPPPPAPTPNAGLPFDVLSGDTVVMAVQPTLDKSGNMANPATIFTDAGFTPTASATQNPADCSWILTGVNNSGAPITVHPAMPHTNVPGTTPPRMNVKGLTVNGVVVQDVPPTLPAIPPPHMRACHAFTLSFIPTPCMPIAGGPYDPTVGLDALGITSFTLQPEGPDETGQYTIDGVWELGDGFVLPQSQHFIITDFMDNGSAKNVPTGPCASGLPYALQPGDKVTGMIVRPMAVPGQPMTDPVAVLMGLGFQNITPAVPYSDCTWVLTADWMGPGVLQLTDPLVGIGGGEMWIVGVGINGTTIKDANWTALQERPIDLVQCNQYSVLFTFDTCPALSGAPGSWDPTAAITTLLPGFKVAPGPNEYGEWAATGTWKGQDTTLTGSGGVHFTLLIDYGANAGCTKTCPTGQIADTKTAACVTPCSDGSAPNGGVCPQPVKGVGPVTPPAATSSVGTTVAVVGGLGVLGALAWFALKK